MLCPNCGATIADGSLICPICQTEIVGQAETGPGAGLDLDATVPGSDLPGGPGGRPRDIPHQDMISPKTMDSRYMELPDQGEVTVEGPTGDLAGGPDVEEDIEVSTGGAYGRSRPWIAIVVVVVVLIAGMFAYVSLRDDDGDGDNGEPNGNGNGPETGIVFDKALTTGVYPYEPPGEYHVTVVIKNNDTTAYDLTGHDIYVTIFIGQVKKGEGTLDLSGTLAPGASATHQMTVTTELLGGGDQIKVSLILRKDGGNTSVAHHYFEQTL